METLTTCPRGHALAENAVLCTVCWIRVSSDDSAAATARSKRRRMVVAIPLVAVGCLAVGTAVIARLASAPGDVVVAAAPLPTAPLPTAPLAVDPVAASSIPAVPVEEPVSVAVAPLAATVPKPVESVAAPDCLAEVRGGQIDCTLVDDRLEFTLCVPGATTLIRVGTRPDNTVKFTDAVSEVALGGPSTCAADETLASVRIDSYSPDVTWRIVGRDAADKKIWKSRVVAPVSDGLAQ